MMPRVALPLLFTVLACHSATEALPRAVSPSHDGSMAVELELDVTRRIGPLSLRWIEVADSRCPIGVTCVRPGEVRVTLLVSSSNDAPPSTVELELEPGREPSPILFASHQLRLLAVDPAPRDGVAIGAEERRARVELTKAPAL